MAHFRYFELANEFQQEIYRLGANYKLNSTLNFTLGLSYVTTDFNYKVASNEIEEFRVYEDLNINSKLGKILARHRIRLEHRFIENSSMSNWFRYDLTMNFPLFKSWSILNEIKSFSIIV